MKILKRILTVVIIIGLLVWAGITLMNNKKKSEEEISIVAKQNDSIAVNIAQVSYEKINSDYVANGTFLPLQELMLTSEAPGKVVRLLVREGEKVKAGQTLAVIRGDAQSVDLSTAEAAYQNALKDNQRFEKALESGGVTQQQVDMSRLQLKNAKAQVDQARIRMGDTNVKSSIDGIVNQRMIETGTFVSPGMPMFEIVDISGLKLRVEINENQVVNYNEGDTISIKAAVRPDEKYEGTIKFIASKATASLNFPVEIHLNNIEENQLKAGMYGTAIFSSGEKGERSKPVLVIPRESFVGGLNNSEVFVLNDDNTVHLTKVSIGRNLGKKVEILSGLDEGQKIVTSGQINLTDGALVRIMN